jgi:hypothetical protein
MTLSPTKRDDNRHRVTENRRRTCNPLTEVSLNTECQALNLAILGHLTTYKSATSIHCDYVNTLLLCIIPGVFPGG